MARICDICGQREATVVDRAVMNNVTLQYAYCEACYRAALQNGINPRIEADRIRKFNSKTCDVCGMTAEKFDEGFLFGCPECYTSMRAFALKVVQDVQGSTRHVGKEGIPFDLKNKGKRQAYKGSELPSFAADGDYIKRIFGDGGAYRKGGRRAFRPAAVCSTEEMLEMNVMSSRIRLARNIRGLNFPAFMHENHNLDDEIAGAYTASKGLFDARVRKISDLDNAQKKALIERHIISLNLANNDRYGAVIVDGGNTGFSVMINEEDHFREQCVMDGFNLRAAHYRINAYDTNLMRELPIAYDKELGFLTACPTNVGTGMRASVMLFLPALKRKGAIDEELSRFKAEYGLTIRGMFGEGSDPINDAYQISNSRTLGIDERDTIMQVEEATRRMCYCERLALEQILIDEGESYLDEILRSYNFLISAKSLEYDEFLSHVSAIRVGAILDVLPKRMTPKQVDKLALLCSPSSIEIATKTRFEDPSALRAEIVRAVLEDKR